jgi:hypothetical protein
MYGQFLGFLKFLAARKSKARTPEEDAGDLETIIKDRKMRTSDIAVYKSLQIL